MNESNIILYHLPARQGTNVYNSSLIEALKPTYFKSEPRATAYWINEMRYMSEHITAHNINLSQLIPAGISTPLLVEYIKDPLGTIAEGKFTKEEIYQLRQPQLIMLFYFLKKLARLEKENEQIIRKTNNIIARGLFQATPLIATPDYGFAVFNAMAGTEVNIPKGVLLDAIVEGEIDTRKYISTSTLIGHCTTLDSFITASKVMGKPVQKVYQYPLPLEQYVSPLADVEVTAPGTLFVPSLIIQSPLLSLSQGTREIKLQLVIRGGTLAKNNNSTTNFKFQITTEKGWVLLRINGYSIKQSKNGDSIHSFYFKMNVEWPSIEPITEDLPVGESYAQKSACLKVQYNAPIFTIVKTALQVNVSRLTPSVLRNQEQVIDPQDNYNPFGLDAPTESVFSFGHPELADRKIQKITLIPKWVGKPVNINKYYKAYGKTENKFVVAVRSIYKEADNSSIVVLDREKKLFSRTISFEPLNGPLLEENWNVDETDPLEQPLSYQLLLNGQSFGHREYPLLMTNYTIKETAYERALFKKNKEQPEPVNVPYTPQFSKLLINYESETVIWSAKSTAPASLTLIKNAPLGYSTYNGELFNSKIELQNASYFGMNLLTRNSAASLYFHGFTGNTNTEEATVQWSYLSESGWKDLEPAEILFDGTYGFTREGLLYWKVPVDMVNNNTLMPKGKYWLKLVAKAATQSQQYIARDLNADKTMSYVDSLMCLRGIYANGFPISRQTPIDQKIANELPAESKIYFEDDTYDLPVSVPVDTTAGIAQENRLDFWVRVFNRVRNRGRMVVRQDFEDLILYTFRELVLAKCISRDPCSNYVEVVVMLKINPEDLILSNNNTIIELPWVPQHTLQQIESTMLPLATPFFQFDIRLKISNPCYVNVGFLVHVVFKGGATDADNTIRLSQDLQRFVNPWFFEEKQAPQFGCWFEYGALMSYLQGKGYIEAILAIKLGIVVGTELTFPTDFQFKENQIMVVTNPGSIIVADTTKEYERLGIGTMIINYNFYVGV